MDENLMNSSAEVAETQKQQDIPAKFKDPKTGELKVADLLKSYLALEKKLGERSAAMPAQITTPASPDDYQIELKSDFLTMDPEMNKRLFELGFSNDQLQAVYDLAAEKVLPLLQELADDYKSKQEMGTLEESFGGPEQFNTIARQISAWGEKNLNPSIFDTLSCSCDGILTMYKMMNDGIEPSIRAPRANTETDTEDALRKLMQDPKYWKKQDPALVKRVEEGYKRLYNK